MSETQPAYRADDGTWKAIPLYQQPIPAGSKVPQRAIEQRPVEIPYLKALQLRETLDTAAKVIRTMANSIDCRCGTDRCAGCEIESLADDLRAGELLLRGEP